MELNKLKLIDVYKRQVLNTSTELHYQVIYNIISYNITTILNND